MFSSRRSRRWLTLWMLCCCALLSSLAHAVTVDDLQARTYANAAGKATPYRLFVPPHYDAAQKYPLILFLHGAGERGNDNRKQLANHPAPLNLLSEEEGAKPCFFLAPQCPEGEQWVDTPWGKGSYSTTVPVSDNLQDVLAIIGQTEREFSIDTQRLYVTGMSMGGYGTWDLVTRNPQMFAAALPVCGAGDPTQAANLKGVALWAFHSADDGTVPVSGSRDMLRALWGAGQTPSYTEYANGGHDAWTRAYNTKGLAAWLFSFHR